MPVYPETTSHLNNFTRADGTTVVHSSDHARVIDLVVNAKHYLKGNGATENQADIDAFAAACAGKEGFFPPGTYAWPDGGSMNVAQSTTIRGAGKRATYITCKNAYAFTSTSTDTLTVEGFGFTVRTGATTGGAIKFDSTQATIRNIEVSSVSTSTDPGIYLKGTIGSLIDRAQVQGMTAHGIRLDSLGGTLAFNNANYIRNTRVNSVQGSTNAGIYLGGWGGNRVRDCVIESNKGYGVMFDQSTDNIVEGCWFEDNSNHNVYVTGVGAYNPQIIHNKFESNHGDIGTANHIRLDDIASPSSDSAGLIMGNAFTNPATSGINLYIGTNWEHTAVIGNRKLWAAATTDNGTATLGFGNWDPSNQGITKLGDVFSPPLRVKGSTQTGDNGNLQQTALFATSDSLEEDEFGVTREGYGVFHTKNVPTTTSIPTNSFIIYWDNAAGQVKARVRDNAGSVSNIVLG